MPRSHLVAVDESSIAEHAFSYALKHTPKEDTIVIIHGKPLSMKTVPGTIKDIDIDQANKAHALMDRYAAACKAADRKCDFVNIGGYNGPSELAMHICRRAAELDVATVFTGSRGLSHDMSTFERLSRATLGSVSTQIANQCFQPVVIVKKFD